MLSGFKKGTEYGTFQRPAGNTFAGVSSKCRFLDDKTYCCVITRNGPIPKVLEDMRVAVKISHFSLKYVHKMQSVLDMVRVIYPGLRSHSSCGPVEQSQGRVQRKGVKHGSLSRGHHR